MSFLNIKSVLASVCAMALASNLMAADEPSTKKGDANLDGTVSAEDVELIAQHILGEKTLTGQALANANVDGSKDGVNVADILLILEQNSRIGFGEGEGPSSAEAPVRRDNNE